MNHNTSAEENLPCELLKLVNIFFGILYGLPMFTERELVVTIINTIEAIIMIIYVICLINLSGETNQIRRRYIMFSSFILLAIPSLTSIGFWLTKIGSFHKRYVVCSALYMAMNIVASIAVYPDLKKAWKTKSVDHMSLFWIVLEFMGGVCMIVFGLLPLDIYIFVPNLFEIVLSAVQFITYIVYRTSFMPPPREYDLECCRGSLPSTLVFVFNPLFQLEEE